MGHPTRTRVGIVGAGPAGLLLARLLHLTGIDCVILERRDRTYVERRQRAGILEQSTVDALRSAGAADRLEREGTPHDGVELRFARRSLRLDFPSLTGGRRVWLYAQTELVKDLIALQQKEGPPLLFEARALAVEGNDGDRPLIRYAHAGREHTLVCDWVVGCDGYHGVTRHGMPEGVLRTYERGHPYSWFGILADAPPAYEELIYAHSERGFALASMRSAHVSRLYLQVPNGTDPEQWSDERVWNELDARLATRGGRRLHRGPITSKAVLPMRSSVTEPMAHGRIFLAGDAAHIVPPTGAKGLNLAAADAMVLGRAFAHLGATGSTELLDAYSDTCLRRVWRAEHFSNLMTSMLHLSPDQSEFDTRLQLSQLERLATSPHAAAELAANYAGLPVGGDAGGGGA
ncbi:4-hydroxybenzoate 3-monooxygenase [Streptomyces sp. 6N223]|uniref:4-hydroxybenzoate 3-monooxygenase n=1 Tax=Streptomyces sp. 6N223 TaxID=3457412 RepID=UPI003FD1FF9D